MFLVVVVSCFTVSGDGNASLEFLVMVSLLSVFRGVLTMQQCFVFPTRGKGEGIDRNVFCCFLFLN